jgi:hypothetical protein
MMNDNNIKDYEEFLPKRDRPMTYKTKSYIIYALLSVVIVTLSILLVIFIRRKPIIPVSNNSFNFAETRVVTNQITSLAGEKKDIILEFYKNDGYFVDYELKNLNIVVENFTNSVEITEIHRGKISVQISSTKPDNYTLYININSVRLSTVINYLVKPGLPSSYNIFNFNKLSYSGVPYVYYMDLYDAYGNNIISNNSFIGCYNLDYTFRLVNEQFYSNNTKYSIENYNGTQVYAFYITYKVLTETFNFPFQISYVRENIQYNITQNASYITNLYRMIDVKNTQISFSDNSNFQIQLFDGNGIPIDFRKETEISITGDGMGCGQFSQVLTQSNLKYVDQNGSIVVKGEVLAPLYTSCQYYYIISFIDSVNLSNVIYYYKEIEIFEDLYKKNVTKLYDSIYFVLNDFSRVDLATYLRSIVDGGDLFFDYTNEIRANPDKMNAALYIVLTRIFINCRVLYYKVMDKVTLYGDIYVLNNKYQTISYASATGKEFKKVKVIVNDSNNRYYTIFIYLNENFSPLITGPEGHLEAFYFSSENVYTRLVMEETSLNFLLRISRESKVIYSNTNKVLELIQVINPSMLTNTDKLIEKIKNTLGMDIVQKYEAAVAFNKNRYFDFDVNQRLTKEYLFAAVSFVSLNTFYNKLRFLSVDLDSIKLGSARGTIDMMSPQGNLGSFNLTDKRVYESKVYCLNLETNSIVSFYTYFYFTNFNLIINSSGNFTKEFIFIPEISDGRKNNTALIQEYYQQSFNIAHEYLASKFIEIRKLYEDRDINPNGPNYDLCRDNSVKNQKILLAKFHSESGFSDQEFNTNVVTALVSKGFITKLVTNEADFYTEIENNKDQYTSVWVIPNNNEPTQSFGDLLVKFYESGKSIFLWGDNDYLYRQSNAFIKKLYGNETYYLIGNYAALNKMKSGDGKTTGTFDKFHPVGRGFVSLNEGHSVCSWNEVMPGFKTFGILNYPPDKPVIFYKEGGAVSGRILVDCGFTKMYTNYFDQNVRRYLTNAACWLGNLENDPEVEN